MELLTDWEIMDLANYEVRDCRGNLISIDDSKNSYLMMLKRVAQAQLHKMSKEVR